MADDQQLGGYPEVAAHLGISVRAAHSRKSRGTLPEPDDTRVPDRPRRRPATLQGWQPVGRGFRTTCTALHPADRQSVPPIGCGHADRLADAVPAVPLARQRRAPADCRQRHRVGPQRRRLGGGGDPPRSHPRWYEGHVQGEDECPGCDFRGELPKHGNRG